MSLATEPLAELGGWRHWHNDFNDERERAYNLELLFRLNAREWRPQKNDPL